MTKPIPSFKRISYALALSLCLPLISFSASPAQAMAPSPAPSGGGSETCNQQRMQDMENTANTVANGYAQKLYAAVTPPPTSADLSCIADGSLQGAIKGTELFSNNSSFCSSGPCNSKLGQTLMQGSIAQLERINVSSLFSFGSLTSVPPLSSIASIISSILPGGLSLPSSCDGPQKFLEATYKGIDPSLTMSIGSMISGGVNPASLGPNTVAGALQALTAPSVSTPTQQMSTAVAEGDCELQTTTRGSRTFYSCLPGPNTACIFDEDSKDCTVVPSN
ncbi:MAG: hypothetical protein AB7E85_06230 [Pseudobdellovibrionaceae bacterium]